MRGMLLEQLMWYRLHMYKVTRKEFIKFKGWGDMQISKGRAGISLWV